MKCIYTGNGNLKIGSRIYPPAAVLDLSDAEFAAIDADARKLIKLVDVQKKENASKASQKKRSAK